jgi:hypothetical protein
MSDSESVVAVAYYEDVDGRQHSQELTPGERFQLDCDLAEYVSFEVRPADDNDLETDGGTERFGYSDERWEREVREKKRRGQDSLDKSQTVREAAQPLVTSLRGCRRSDHCHRLADVVRGIAAVEHLDYEDLFFPLRCHRDDGLVLRVEGPSGQNWMQYGAGDLFYWMTDDERTIVSAVDPFELWDAISPGSVEVEPVLVEDTPYGEDDDD